MLKIYRSLLVALFFVAALVTMWAKPTLTSVAVIATVGIYIIARLVVANNSSNP